VTAAHPVGRVAYLVSEYPAVSHTFIEREVLALRRLGVEVDTYSVRPASPGSLLSAVSVAEAASTRTLRGHGPAHEAVTVARFALTRPLTFATGLWHALRAGRLALRPKLWQLFYLAEAVILLTMLRPTGVRHVHTHFANNAADVARLVVAMGLALDGERSGWRWTLSMHGPTEFGDPVGFDLAAKAGSASAVACISEYCRDALAALVPARYRGRFDIVRMSVDTEQYRGAAALREERELGPLRVLFVGRLVPEKDPLAVVDAIRRLRAAGTDVECAVAGDGPLAPQLRAAVAAGGLGAHVRLLGSVGQDELPGWYEWADVFCLPSFAEGLPVVLMEAMASELPVVTTPIAAIPELVVDGENGLLVRPGAAEELQSALERLAAAPAVRARIGRDARLAVLGEHDPDENAKRLVRLFERTAPEAVGG
jgi:colanic acid/amylovoran biosynthesis glycosyltransferase